MIRVGVFGAGGRMGGEVCRAVTEAPDMELVAAVDPAAAGRPLGDLVVAATPEPIAEAKADVAVDFTVAESARANIRWCLGNGVAVVVGTTGISPEELRGLVNQDPKGSLFYAPNFAIGAVLMMRFARIAAAWLPDAEVIELHHASKKDSPSGTSLATVGEILAGREQTHARPLDPVLAVETVPGARGAEREGVHVHSVRLPGLVAHQEVIFGASGQTLTIRHDTTDRAAFMPGVLLAIREAPRRPGLIIGLEQLLGL